jgi:SAM-dependent methyltransferase
VSHPEQLAFFQAVVGRNRGFVAGARVLEIGSYDVNGSIRSVFEGAGEYVGVDLTQGPGVDLVAYGHQVDHPDGTYDIAVSGECFEHDPHWRDTFANMVRLARAGGLVVFTCASHGRPEHGTRRSDLTDSPGTQAEGMDYYRNLVAADFDRLPLGEWFSEWRFWYMPTTFDLYFAGVRSGAASTASLPQDEDLAEIRRLLPWPHRLVRVPLRLTASVVRDEDRYQRLVMPYWLALLRRSTGHHRAGRTG